MNFDLKEIPEWWINKSVLQYTIEKSIPLQQNLMNKVAYLSLFILIVFVFKKIEF